MSYNREINIHQTNINRGYIVLCQEGVDPVQGPTKDGLQDDILTGWNKKNTLCRVNIYSNWEGYVPVLVQTKYGIPIGTFYSVCTSTRRCHMGRRMQDSVTLG